MSELVEIKTPQLVLSVTAIAKIAHNLDIIIDDNLKPMLANLSKIDITGENRLAMAKHVISECNAIKKDYDSGFISFNKDYEKPKLVIDEKRKIINELIEQSKKEATIVRDTVLAEMLAEKTKQAEDYYNTLPIASLVDFSKLKGDKWKNEGCKLKDIKKELDEKADKIQNELNILGGMQHAERYNIQAFYVSCLSLDKTIEHLNTLIENEKRLKVEQERKAEEERQAQELAEWQAKQEVQEVVEVADDAIVNTDTGEVIETAKPYKEWKAEQAKGVYIITLECSIAQKNKIEQLLESEGIVYDIETGI